MCIRKLILWLILVIITVGYSPITALAEEVPCPHQEDRVRYRCFRAEAGATGQVDSWIQRINQSIPEGQEQIGYRHYDNANLANGWLLCRESHNRYINQVRNFSRDTPMTTSDYTNQLCPASTGTVMRWVRAGKIYRVPRSAIPTPGDRQLAIEAQIQAREAHGGSLSLVELNAFLEQIHANEMDTTGMRPTREETSAAIAAVGSGLTTLIATQSTEADSRQAVDAQNPQEPAPVAASEPTVIVSYQDSNKLYLVLAIALCFIVILLGYLLHDANRKREVLAVLVKKLQAKPKDDEASLLTKWLKPHRESLGELMDDLYDSRKPAQERFNSLVKFLLQELREADKLLHDRDSSRESHARAENELTQARSKLSELEAEAARLQEQIVANEAARLSSEYSVDEERAQRLEHDLHALQNRHLVLEQHEGELRFQHEAAIGALVRMANDIIVRLGGNELDEKAIRLELADDPQSIINHLFEAVANAIDQSPAINALQNLQVIGNELDSTQTELRELRDVHADLVKVQAEATFVCDYVSKYIEGEGGDMLLALVDKSENLSEELRKSNSPGLATSDELKKLCTTFFNSFGHLLLSAKTTYEQTPASSIGAGFYRISGKTLVG